MRYDYRCEDCRITWEFDVPMDERDTRKCGCPGCDEPMKRQFPTDAIKGFQPFEAYHCPARGIDINGPGEDRETMRAMGIHEAGDPVNGARNFETSKEAVTLDREPPTGRRLSDIQREQEHSQNMKDNFMVQVEDKDGKLSNPLKASELSTSSAAVKSGQTPTRTKMKVKP
tara:strand:+ start:412 stop:924 length:513 start_codon:yes stop_codon:yes gene_type:complete